MGLFTALTINLSISWYLKEMAFGGSFLCLNLYVNKDRKMKCIFWAERGDIHCDPFCMINFRMLFVPSLCCHYLTVTKKKITLFALAWLYFYYLKADWKIVFKKKISISELKRKKYCGRFFSLCFKLRKKKILIKHIPWPKQTKIDPFSFIGVFLKREKSRCLC